MHGSRSKIPVKNLVRQRCAEGFNSGVKGLRNFYSLAQIDSGIYQAPYLKSNEKYFTELKKGTQG
jgi:hypothetical protein